VSAVADWVQETICKLTDNATDLTFGCPDFVCPADTVVFGVANLKVPSASDGARSYNGFAPVSITQTPTAGSTLKYGGDTFVKVTATDAGGTSISCRWKVTVPVEDLIGYVAVRLPAGNSGSRTALALYNKSPGMVRQFGGFVYVGSLEGQPGGVVTATLRAGLNVTSRPLTLDGDTEDVVALLRPRVPFNYRSNLRVVLTAQNVPRTTVLIYFIYGQQWDLDANGPF
jgi:hypothetical protein